MGDSIRILTVQANANEEGVPKPKMCRHRLWSLEERDDGVVDALNVSGGYPDPLLVDVDGVGAANLVAAGLDHCAGDSIQLSESNRCQKTQKLPMNRT